MISLLSKLDARFNGGIVRIQLALDNCWENAWVLNGHSKPNDHAIDSYLNTRFKGIACEAFFSDSTGRRLFLGISRQANKSDIVETKKWTIKVLDALDVYTAGIIATLNRISNALDDFELFQHSPTSIEVGVTDFWDSCGAELVWRASEPQQLSKATLLQQLSANDDLYATRLNYQAVEFGFEGAYPHWIGIQVGKKNRSGIYEINVDDLFDLSSRVTGRGKEC